MIRAVSDALLNNNNLLEPTVIFVLNYIVEELNCVKQEKHLAGSWRTIWDLPPSPTTLNFLDDDSILSKGNKSWCVRCDKNNKNDFCSSTVFLQFDAWSMTSSAKTMEVDDSSSVPSAEKR